MGRVADRWAARDEQPIHLPPNLSLHQETTGALRVKLLFKYISNIGSSGIYVLV